MQKGDIVIIPFPFTDFSGQKLRPALVLYVSLADVTVAFITSQVKGNQANDVLLKGNSHTGLKQDSMIVLHKISTVAKPLIKGYLGSIDQFKMHEVDQKLISIFKIETSAR
ncbi:MAG: type II toxin-antitoxin system PemK/MazF family toxin [Chitinophagales bacterium]